MVMSFLGPSSQVHKEHKKCMQIQQPNPFNYFRPMILASRCRSFSLHKRHQYDKAINSISSPILPSKLVSKMIRKVGRSRQKFHRSVAMPWLLLALHANEDPVPLPCDGDASIGQGSHGIPRSSRVQHAEVVLKVAGNSCFGMSS